MANVLGKINVPVMQLILEMLVMFHIALAKRQLTRLFVLEMEHVWGITIVHVVQDMAHVHLHATVTASLMVASNSLTCQYQCVKELNGLTH